MSYPSLWLMDSLRRMENAIAAEEHLGQVLAYQDLTGRDHELAEAKASLANSIGQLSEEDTIAWQHFCDHADSMPHCKICLAILPEGDVCEECYSERMGGG